MKTTNNYRNWILCIIFFMLGMGIQLIIGITREVNTGVKYWEKGWTDCYDKFDSILKVANDRKKEPIVELTLVGRDTVRVTMYRKQKYRVKK